MSRKLKIRVVLMSFFCILLITADFVAAQIARSELEKIEKAIPKKATVKPIKSRKLLVFNRGKGLVHSAIPYGAKAIELMAQKTGAFEVVQTEDPNIFRPENLKQFDALCFNNSNRMDFFKDPLLAKSLLDFIKNGGGVVGIHAATTNFTKQWLLDWPEGAELLGGVFNDHPWHEKVTIKVDDPTHPLNAAFEGKSFELNDEIYQFTDPYSRDKLRILLSLDTTKTDMNKGSRIKRDDNDFAVSWVKSYGRGRIFYCSLGHEHDIFFNPKILQHYLDGIQFALGDLKVDTTPTTKIEKGQYEHKPVYRDYEEIKAVLDKVHKPASKDFQSKLNIVLLADKKDHGQYEHDYPLWQKCWSTLLSDKAHNKNKNTNLYLTSPKLDTESKEVLKALENINLSTAWQWPTKKQFASADLIVMFCHGRGKWDENKINDVKKFVSNGGGFVVIHPAVITNEKLSKKLSEVIGLAWQEGYTGYRHGPMHLKIIDTESPICLGLPQTIHFIDEAYFPLKGNIEKVSILAVSREGGRNGTLSSEPMFWTYTLGKGRVFGCILGHYTWTFDDPYFRILLLRGMAWAAGQNPYRFDPMVLRNAVFAD